MTDDKLKELVSAITGIPTNEINEVEMTEVHVETKQDSRTRVLGSLRKQIKAVEDSIERLPKLKELEALMSIPESEMTDEQKKAEAKLAIELLLSTILGVKL